MVIGIVWFFLGLLYWTAFVAGAAAVATRARKGRRLAGVGWYTLSVSGVVWATSFVPAIAVWVWVPVVFLPLAWFGMLRGALGA